jgi:cytoskeletal protein RodZ
MTAMSPLASVMLLAFLFVIALALLVWALLQGRPSPPAPPSPPPPRSARSTPPSVAGARERAPREDDTRRSERPSNDELRGARAAPKRPTVPDDAFERFLRSDREEGRR